MSEVKKEYDWSDVTPIPQDDGPHPLASIVYTDEYRETMDLLRAVMAAEEHSERALALTAEVINLNPAHYTAWEYRLRILKDIGTEVVPREEWHAGRSPDSPVPRVVENGSWIDAVTIEHPKNYQVWNFRQQIEAPGVAEFYKGELLLVQMVLEDDNKNFHAWSHLKWVFTRAGTDVIKASEELSFTEKLLAHDVRNNSAWSYRFYVFKNDATLYSQLKDLESGAFAAEVEYVKSAISLAPQNESPWNYLVGLYEEWHPTLLGELKPLCLEYSPLDREKEVRSSHALELLVRIYRDEKETQLALRSLDLLEVHVPVRHGYWQYQRSTISV